MKSPLQCFSLVLVSNPSVLGRGFNKGHELVSIQKWPFSAISASIYGISCAAYYLYASAESLDFLDLAKSCSFLNRKLPLASIGVKMHFRMDTS